MAGVSLRNQVLEVELKKIFRTTELEHGQHRAITQSGGSAKHQAKKLIRIESAFARPKYMKNLEKGSRCLVRNKSTIHFLFRLALRSALACVRIPWFTIQ